MSMIFCKKCDRHIDTDFEALHEDECQWESMGANEVLHREGFYISYNPNTYDIPGKKSPETALCVDDKFYILKGDFRKEYEKVEDYKSSKEIFDKNIKHKSSWSN